jgi:dTDP-4-amino-4,6-dideoxygalactose transaminase
MLKIKLNNEWDKVLEFENVISKYCGSKYAVACDSNSNAIKLVLEYLNVNDREIEIPKNTYASVPMQIIHSGNVPKFIDLKWSGEYFLHPLPIVDSACRLKKGMYIEDTYQILSFHHRKILNIGKGGMILTNDLNFVNWVRPMIYDGRHIDKMYNEDEFECIGYHMYMTPEDAEIGINVFNKKIKDINEDCGSYETYKDLTKQNIFKKYHNE